MTEFITKNSQINPEEGRDSSLPQFDGEAMKQHSVAPHIGDEYFEYFRRATMDYLKKNGATETNAIRSTCSPTILRNTLIACFPNSSYEEVIATLFPNLARKSD